MTEQKIVLRHLSEFPYKSIAMATTRSNMTGLWRYWRPYYQTRRSPCDAWCPAGNDAVGVVQAMAEGDLALAARLLREENPLPGLTGRLCPHPCETHCNRRQYDAAISIQAIERLAADLPGEVVEFPKNARPRKVAVLGAGPEELTAAYFLRLLGHDVTVVAAPEEIGGALRKVPAGRVPDGVLDAELERLWALGIKRLAAASAKELGESFDHVMPAAESAGGTGIPAVSPQVGRGKRAALLLDAEWRGLDPEAVLSRISVARERAVSAVKYRELLAGLPARRIEERVVEYKELNLDFFVPATRDELNGAADRGRVAAEAARCFSCGVCNQCDKCRMFCPDLCISRDEAGKYTIDYDYCKGCVVCAAVCPRRVISVIEEKKWKG